jgi:DNA-binding XRE family transcriptional regulator
MTREERHKDYEINFKQYVEELMKFPDAKLARRLDLVRAQMVYCEKNKDNETWQTLRWWELHTIEARIRKQDLPETPYVDEIEAAIADMETVQIKTEDRHEIFIADTPQKVHRPKIKEDNSDQISLF